MKFRVHWLPAFLLLVATMMLAAIAFSGCADPQRDQRQDKAYTAAEKLMMFEIGEYGAGRMTLAELVADLRKTLDDLKASERSDQPAGTDLYTTIEIALGSSGLGAAALHLLRNWTRKRELEDVPTQGDLDDATQRFEGRLKELEMKALGRTTPTPP